MLSDPNPDYAITIVKIFQGLQKTDAASAVLHFFAVSPVNQYEKDQDHDQYMDGVVSEDRDGILLKGNHCTLISTRQDIFNPTILNKSSTFSHTVYCYRQF